jgi:hypothetical protein
MVSQKKGNRLERWSLKKKEIDWSDGLSKKRNRLERWSLKKKEIDWSDQKQKQSWRRRGRRRLMQKDKKKNYRSKLETINLLY